MSVQVKTGSTTDQWKKKQVERQTYDVRGIAAHGNNCPVNGSEQLLHDDLHVPLGWTLQKKKTLIQCLYMIMCVFVCVTAV